MKTISIDNDSYLVPSKWSELTSEQVLLLAKLYLKDASFIKLKVVYCLALMGLRLKYSHPVLLNGDMLYYVKQGKKSIYLLSTEQMHAIVSNLNWLFITTEKKDKTEIQINTKLTENPVRDIKIRFAKFRGPDKALGNISFIEFMHAETYLYRYEKTIDSKWLYMFLASLWRPLKRGTVEPFNQDKIERIAKRLTKVKPHTILAIKWYYAGSKYFLAQKFKRPFEGSGGESKDPFEGYLSLATTLSNNDATKISDLMETNIYFALSALDKMLEAHENKPKPA